MINNSIILRWIGQRDRLDHINILAAGAVIQLDEDILVRILGDPAAAQFMSQIISNILSEFWAAAPTIEFYISVDIHFSLTTHFAPF